jgi:hypothetical protein
MELLPEALKNYPNDEKKPAEWMSAVQVRSLFDVEGLRNNLPKLAATDWASHCVLCQSTLCWARVGSMEPRKYLINPKP